MAGVSMSSSLKLLLDEEELVSKQVIAFNIFPVSPIDIARLRRHEHANDLIIMLMDSSSPIPPSLDSPLVTDKSTRRSNSALVTSGGSSVNVYSLLLLLVSY